MLPVSHWLLPPPGVAVASPARATTEKRAVKARMNMLIDSMGEGWCSQTMKELDFLLVNSGHTDFIPRAPYPMPFVCADMSHRKQRDCQTCDDGRTKHLAFMAVEPSSCQEHRTRDHVRLRAASPICARPGGRGSGESTKERHTSKASHESH